MKVCVYAICKNESQFVDRFMDSMSEADYVCVLDTGSSDDTVKKLRARGAIVGETVVSPWRFDTARNESLGLIPADADICCAIDLDEQFHPGWRAALERAWQPDTTRARYRYTWSFRPDGSEGMVFWADKIHKNGCYRWASPVHETLAYTGEGPACSSTITQTRRSPAGNTCRCWSWPFGRTRRTTETATTSDGSICSAASGRRPLKRSRGT